MATASKAPVLSEEQMESLFANEWVLFEIGRLTPDGRALGRVIFHSRDRAALSEHRIRFHDDHPRAKSGVIFAGPVVDPDFDGMIILEGGARRSCSASRWQQTP